MEYYPFFKRLEDSSRSKMNSGDIMVYDPIKELLNEGEELIDEGRYKEAIETLDEVLEMDPDHE